MQSLEDLPRVKKARIQFTIEKAEADGDEDTGGLKPTDKIDKKIKMSKVRHRRSGLKRRLRVYVVVVKYGGQRGASVLSLCGCVGRAQEPGVPLL